MEASNPVIQVGLGENGLKIKSPALTAIFSKDFGVEVKSPPLLQVLFHFGFVIQSLQDYQKNILCCFCNSFRVL